MNLVAFIRGALTLTPIAHGRGSLFPNSATIQSFQEVGE